MAISHARRNNFLAGAFVLFAIIVAVLVVVLIGGSLESLGKATYVVRFPVETGVGGLATGSPVSVGGLNVGAVKSVKHIIENDQLQSIEVRAAVSKKIPLRQGAIASLEQPLLGGGGMINFTQLGDGARLTSRDIIPGRLAPPGFLASAGFGDEEREHVRSFLAAVAQGADRFNDTLGVARDDWAPRVSRMLGDTEGKYDTWLERIDAATVNIEQTTARGPEIAKSFEERLEGFAQVVADARTIIDENREDFRAVVASARSATDDVQAGAADARVFMDRLNSELTDRAMDILDGAAESVDHATAILTRADATFIEQQPNIRRTLANARLASDQLRDTAAEIRRSPWRLVYRPNDRELEYELLYDSARSFAGAVGELRTTSESLQTMLDSGHATDASNPQIASLIESLEAAFARYRDAEKSLLDQLINE
jgi:ABC-type transporter Mla subunit MlaD